MLTETDLLDLLKSKSLNFQIHTHEPLFTVEDSENYRGNIIGEHTKNLFLFGATRVLLGVIKLGMGLIN